MDDIKGNINAVIPTIIASAWATTTVTATSADVEKELIFPDDSTSVQIIETVESELGVNFKTPFKEQILESINIAKTYVKEVEIGLTWDEGFKFKITRSPKKIIKSQLSHFITDPQCSLMP
jgi:hypothetical protein